MFKTFSHFNNYGRLHIPVLTITLSKLLPAWIKSSSVANALGILTKRFRMLMQNVNF